MGQMVQTGQAGQADQLGRGRNEGRGRVGPGRRRTEGFSLWTLLVVIFFVVGVALPALRAIPSLTEYFSVKRAASYAKQRATNKREVVEYFDKQASIDQITAVRGEDLQIREDDNGTIQSVDFAYRTEVPVYGPLSLLISYSGTQH